MLTAHFDGASFFAPDADDPDDIRALGNDRRLQCPFCEAPVHFRGRIGGEKIWHFAHFPGTTCTVDDPDYRPESQEHQQIKLAIYQWLIDCFGENTADVERRVETGQIADVLFQHNNHRIAFEVQRSPLSSEDWLARRKSYRSIGVHDIWIIVGDRHLSVEPVLDSSNDESAEPVVNPGPLAQSLFETDGRVLWVSDAHVDHLRSAQPAVQIPSAADLLITELAGLPHLYDAISVPPGKTRHRFDGAPFQERPEDLIGAVVDNVPYPMWAETASQPTIPVASTNPAEMEIFHIDFSRLPTPTKLSTEDGEANEETTAQGATDLEKGSLHGPWALVSPATPLTSYDHAIQWENARTAWTRDWTIRRKQWEAQARRKQQEKKRDALIAIGKVVDAHLRDLLCSLNDLKKAAGDMSAHQIQHHAGIDPEVRKWDIRNWTPLADLDTGIDWIFGVPRRLWQAVVYTTQFYHKYAERYRESAKVGTSDYGFRKSEFAIKAFHHRGILTGKWRATARFPQASADVEDAIEAVKYDVPIGKRRQATSPPSKITLHGLRHVAVTSYMESLVRHRFLERNQGSPSLSALPGPRLHESLRSACSYVRARNRSSRPPSASTFVHLAEQWLFWARHIRSVRQASYALTCPNHPPFFTDADHSRVRNAMDAEQLSPTKNGMQTVDGSTIMRFNRKESYTADWVVGKGRIWRSRQ